MDTQGKDEVIQENLVRLEKMSGNQWDPPRVTANCLVHWVVNNPNAHTDSSPHFLVTVEKALWHMIILLVSMKIPAGFPNCALKQSQATHVVTLQKFMTITISWALLN